MLDTKIFSYFLVACRHQSFARAAQELHISPQGLGNAMRRLERELGVPLFDDSGIPGGLTPYGRLVRDYAQQVHDSLTDMRRGIDALLAHSRNVVRLGCSSGVLGYLGEGIIEGFNEGDLGTQVLVTGEMPDLRCERALIAGECELALLVDPPSDDFVAIPIVRDYQFFWVHVRNPLSYHNEIVLEDLKNKSIAMVGDEFKNTNRLMGLLTEHGVPVHFHFTGEMMRVYEMARAGVALGLTCRNHVEATAESTRTVGVPFKALPWGFSLCHRRDHALTESEACFVDYLRGKRRVYA